MYPRIQPGNPRRARLRRRCWALAAVAAERVRDALRAAAAAAARQRHWGAATAGWAADRCAAYAANQQDCCKAKHEQRLRAAHKRGKFKIHGRRLACNAGACAHITKDHTQLTQLALEKRPA